MANDSNNHAKKIEKIHQRLNTIDKKIDEIKKQSDTEDPHKPTGKCKKARHRLNAIDKEIDEIKKQLIKARDAFSNITQINSKLDFSKNEGANEEKSKEIREELKQKKRSMVAIVPERIEFESNSLKFYIDFTLVASERDGQSNIKGSIIYGTSRTLCFSDCIYPNSKDPKTCERCERILRCDGLEDKPLISFEINQHGMIQSRGKLEGEWWIKEIPDLVELHYRTLDLIWQDALDWANEIILP